MMPGTPTGRCSSQGSQEKQQIGEGERDRETQREREIDFKGLAHTMGKPELSRAGQWAGNSSRISMFLS